VLLGHSSIRITERHYAPWTRSRQEQIEADWRPLGVMPLSCSQMGRVHQSCRERLVSLTEWSARGHVRYAWAL